MISALVVESRLPVGSSASRIDGSFTSARAIATRWRCPPESSLGRCSMRSPSPTRSEEHTSELQSQSNLVCRLLLEKKKNNIISIQPHTVISAKPHVDPHNVTHQYLYT